MGEKNGKKMSLSVLSLPEKRIIAARFQKTDSYGMIWTSDLVLNLEEKRLSVWLDQEVTEQTSSFFYRFSPIPKDTGFPVTGSLPSIPAYPFRITSLIKYGGEKR